MYGPVLRLGTSMGSISLLGRRDWLCIGGRSAVEALHRGLFLWKPHELLSDCFDEGGWGVAWRGFVGGCWGEASPHRFQNTVLEVGSWSQGLPQRSPGHLEHWGRGVVREPKHLCLKEIMLVVKVFLDAYLIQLVKNNIYYKRRWLYNKEIKKEIQFQLSIHSRSFSFTPGLHFNYVTIIFVVAFKNAPQNKNKQLDKDSFFIPCSFSIK